LSTGPSLRQKFGYGFYNRTINLADRQEAALIKTQLSFPTHTSPTRPWKEVEADLKNHLTNHSDQIHDELLKAAVEIQNFQNKNIQEGNSQNNKSVFLFEGGGGIGKTQASVALARALKRPFCRLNMGNIDLDDLFGKLSEASSSTSSERPKMGLLAKCFVSPDEGEPASDPVILLDEIHDPMNAGDEKARKAYGILKLLSEANETEVTDHLAQMKLYIGNATFIYGTNEQKLKYDPGNALMSRLTRIIFPPQTFEQKHPIAKIEFERLCKEGSYAPTPADWNVIEQLAHNDKEDGSRTLIKSVKDYMVFLNATAKTNLKNPKFDPVASLKRNGASQLEETEIKHKY